MIKHCSCSKEEVWKEYHSDPSYDISNWGRIRNSNKPPNLRVKPFRILTGGLSRGYYGIHLRSGIYKAIHRLVAETYIDNPHNLPQVNHIDGNKRNNCLCNLEWVTARDNQLHALSLGLKVSQKGQEHGLSKLTDSEVGQLIEDFYLKGKTFNMLANEYNISKSHVVSILNGSRQVDLLKAFIQNNIDKFLERRCSLRNKGRSKAIEIITSLGINLEEICQ